MAIDWLVSDEDSLSQLGLMAIRWYMP